MGKRLVMLGADFSTNAIYTSDPSESSGSGSGSGSGNTSTTTYSVTKTLSGYSTSNSATSVTRGNSYICTLILINGYTDGTVQIKMGGTDITSSVYNNSTRQISISSVTGNITITATAVASSTPTQSITLTSSNTTMTDNEYINCSTGQLKTSDAYAHTGYIDVSGYTQYTILNNPQHVAAFFDSNKTFLSGEADETQPDVSTEARTYNIPSNAVYAIFNAVDVPGANYGVDKWYVTLS